MNSHHGRVIWNGVVCILIAFSALAAYAAPQPCSLLNPTQVSAALGSSPSGQPIGTTGCQWIATGKMLTVTLAGPQAFPTRRPLPNISYASAPGIGNEAVYTTAGKFVTLAVKKGSTVAVIRVYGFPVGDAEAKEKAVALAVVPKL